MAFWAQSAGDPPAGVMPSKGTGPTPQMLEDMDARDKYAQAFGAASAWGPTLAGQSVDAAYIDRNDVEARKFQDANIARLQSIAAGGPGGVAVPTAQANLASAGKMNAAYTASRPTTNAAASMRLAGNTNAAQQATGASRIAMLGAQEQMAAYAALNPALASMRAQDFGAASEQAKLKAQANLANAGFAQNAALANQQAWQAQQGLKRGALGNTMAFNEGVFNDSIARRRALMGDSAWRNQFEMELQGRRDARDAAYIDTAAKGMGYLADAYGKEEDPKTKSASDRRVKHKVRDGGDALAEMFDAAFGGE